MRIKFVFFAAIVFAFNVHAAKEVSAVNAAMNGVNSATFADIQSTLGAVPTFFTLFPEEALPGAWEEMKAIQVMPNTDITSKNKELIGIAVSAQIPCRYCVYFHTKFARLNGATDREINEAIAIAAIARKWSAFFYGHQLNFDDFKSDVKKMVKKTKNMMEKNEKPPAPLAVTDQATALKDVENQFGFVPEFIKLYPKAGIAGAWKEMRDFFMNPKTALPGKIKGMISLAVASQTPCQYCIHIDTEFAKLDGASQNEISEAVAMAGMVRHWSTVLNGLQIDEIKFKTEVDKLASGIVKRRVANSAETY